MALKILFFFFLKKTALKFSEFPIRKCVDNCLSEW